MKNFILPILVLLMVASCKKDNGLERDKFIGNYTGTVSIILKGDNTTLSNETKAINETIVAGLNASDVIIGKDSDIEVTAFVTESSLFIDEQTNYVDLDGGISLPAKIKGSGTLSSNGTLTISYVMTATYQNIAFTWNIVETLNKN